MTKCLITFAQKSNQTILHSDVEYKIFLIVIVDTKKDYRLLWTKLQTHQPKMQI